MFANNEHVRGEALRALGVFTPVSLMNCAPMRKASVALTLREGVRFGNLIERDQIDRRGLQQRAGDSASVEDDVQPAHFR